MVLKGINMENLHVKLVSLLLFRTESFRCFNVKIKMFFEEFTFFRRLYFSTEK